MRDLVPATDAEIEARFSDLGIGLTIDDVVFTRDTLAHFRAARQYYKRAGRIVGGPAGTLTVLGVQVVPNRPWRNLYVVDFGDVRAVAS